MLTKRQSKTALALRGVASVFDLSGITFCQEVDTRTDREKLNDNHKAVETDLARYLNPKR